MALTHQEIAEAFSRHDFNAAYGYLAGGVVWNLIGGQQLTGRDRVIAECENSASYLATVETRFVKFRVLSGEDWVVIDSTAVYESPQEARSTVASCDIFRFSAGMIVEITSYNIAISPPIDS
jgi:hypothetical protein